MSYFKLPSLNSTINNDDIHINFLKISHDNGTSNDTTDISVLINTNPSLYFYLKQIKNEINNNYDKWDTFKRYTNPYEYIHTYYDKSNCISKVKPLSRAYYKMVELIKQFKLFEKYDKENIVTFHFAEGPGGFIEAFANNRNNMNDTYYGMTLLDSNDNTPGWRKSKQFLKDNPNVVIEVGATENGDLYSSKNIHYIYKKYSHTCDIVTGDGGFDFSLDFEKQEMNALRLIFSQALFAMLVQKNGGTFIIKVFDLFMKPSLDIIYILNVVYDEVCITKPKTSRYANSEKYVVCRGFNQNRFELIKSKLLHIFFLFERVNFDKYIASSFLSKSCDYNYNFVKSIQEINSILGQQQLSVINNTITLIKKTNILNKIESDKKINILKCIEWCKEHNIPHNEYKKMNIFTD